MSRSALDEARPAGDIQVVVHPDAQSAARAAADRILELVRDHPEAVLGVSTGSSPLPVYRMLARAVDEGTADFSRTRAFALDEYVGLPLNHPAGYHRVVSEHVTIPLGIDPARVSVPDGLAADLEAAGTTYDSMIEAAGGVDLQLAGIGHNGHIGFNEPGAPRDRGTHVVALSARTREANARFFADHVHSVPTHALTQGMGTILGAKEVLVLAFGEGKAEAVARALDGPIDPQSPASLLRTHPRVTFFLDPAAGSRVGNTPHRLPRGRHNGNDSSDDGTP